MPVARKLGRIAAVLTLRAIAALLRAITRLHDKRCDRSAACEVCHATHVEPIALPELEHVNGHSLRPTLH
jgi:hypothetical protein